MKKLTIEGGIPLTGEVTVSGSKNAAVGILPAVLLVDSPCVIENVPDVTDIRLILEILTSLGAKCERDGDVVRIDPTGVNTYVAANDRISRLRGSYYFIGALLGRCGHAEVALPGGCNFGLRPIDQHLKGFSALGAKLLEEYGMVKAHALHGLVGTNIYMDVVSVGATINLMLAACKAAGTTIIENCAREPHVVDVANFLNSMGANIRGAGTNVIKIKGVSSLPGGSVYSIIPDQIEAGTYMIAAAATGGDVTVKNVIPRHMEALSAKLQEMNVGIAENEDSIRVFNKGMIKAVNVKTMPYPGFPTDLQPQIVALLAIAEGESNVREDVWESRFQYVSELCRMGADIKLAGRSAIISGGKHYKGTSVKCPDLRAGAAFVIAALAAAGKTDILNVKYIDRGYCDLEGKLTAIGARIARVEVDEEEHI
ncbi:MAG: UDP-N-acetylglucosamine 1-carboxyvinyltransferase [Clostridia bacterium]|nr:UDP-N-acetylglucosamine 1-carboxyvinyltransferase [Clostridia bacterium]